jgi:uncharacterized protein DUF6328
MAVAIGLLIAPSLQHRLVEQGRASARLLAITTRFAAMALLLFALGLATDLYVVVAYRFGAATGLVIGLGFGALAVMLWYGTARPLRKSRKEAPQMQEHLPPLDVRVEQMLTEARVLIPGAQALFGFQLAVMLTETFGELAQSAKIVHTAALCCIVLVVILLMAPAAFHRIAYGGENTEAFYRLGSCLIVVAALPLALGITLDLYVAATRAFETRLPAVLTALGIGLVSCSCGDFSPLCYVRTGQASVGSVIPNCECYHKPPTKGSVDSNFTSRTPASTVIRLNGLPPHIRPLCSLANGLRQ